jgi:hypothetical protein
MSSNEPMALKSVPAFLIFLFFGVGEYLEKNRPWAWPPFWGAAWLRGLFVFYEFYSHSYLLMSSI